MFEGSTELRPEGPVAAGLLYPMLAPELEVRTVTSIGGRQRFALYHPGRDTTCVLGETELKVAKLFDGRRSLEEVAARALADHRLRLSVDQLKKFEERLRRLRLLDSAVDDAPDLDPLSGVQYGKIRPAIYIRLFSTNPDEALDRLLARFPFLVRRGFFAVCLAVVLAAAGVLALSWQGFLAETPRLPPRGFDLVAVFLLLGLQGVFHEGGHALGCKAFGVRVHEVGLAIYFFLLTAWTRPIQRQWNRLPKAQRLETILLGPFGSLLVGALGVLVWRLSPHGSVPGRLGMLAALSTPISTVPTMLPVFNGDGYLLLTEYFNRPGLRRRSWAYLRERLSRKGGRPGQHARELPRAERRLYLFVSIGTLLGLVGIWLALFGLVAYMVMRELAS
jgi:putative peptide zinc metalloprotease protein